MLTKVQGLLTANQTCNALTDLPQALCPQTTAKVVAQT